MWRKAWAALLMVGLPLGAWAADGDKVAGTSFCRRDYCSISFYLCDSKTSSDSACSEFDFEDQAYGLPHHYTITVDTVTSCSGTPVLVPRGLQVASGTAHDLHAGLTSTGTSAITQAYPYFRIIDATLATMTACTDYNAFITLFYER